MSPANSLMSKATDSVASGVKATPELAALRERDERLEALKILAGHLAHDFNNFLAPILGYLTLIKEEVPANSSAMQYADAMETSARRTERAIESILLATRPQRNFRPETVNFTQLVEQQVKAWQAELTSTAQISVATQLDQVTLSIDKAQWSNVLQQLLRNAWFALATGGKLEVHLLVETLSPEAASDLGLAPGKICRLIFRDEGFGMSSAVQRHAFEPFFTTRPKGQALGLGLSIVHSVVRWHGGQIVLDSQEDIGTKVTILLPIESTVPPVANQMQEMLAALAVPPMRLVGKRVLLVDDDPMVREVLRTCLQRAKLDVFVAKDGLDALAAYKRYGKDVGLVISDITMPNMDGVELTAQIRTQNPSLPFILVSGDADTNLEAMLARLGNDRPLLIKKPFAVKGLIEEVKRLLG